MGCQPDRARPGDEIAQQLARARGFDRDHWLRLAQCLHEVLGLARFIHAQDDVLHADAIDVEQEGCHGHPSVRRLAGKNQVAFAELEQRLAYQAGVDRRPSHPAHPRRQRHLALGHGGLAPLFEELLPARRLGRALLCVSLRHGPSL